MKPTPKASTIVVSPADVAISPTTAGKISLGPATFLEKWGVLFVACAGGWILLVGSGILIYFLGHLPAQPSLAGLSAEQAKEVLNLHKQLYDQWRDSLSYIFDLLVTKTALPIVTLLLGYLFGKGKS